ncbi:hypothetical protein H4582DRAFT_2118412 [Lactarius indigo]|nr:hypothetical protein H4582DRAFT_2118412 [Lactarius indigo]
MSVQLEGAPVSVLTMARAFEKTTRKPTGDELRLYQGICRTIWSVQGQSGLRPRLGRVPLPCWRVARRQSFASSRFTLPFAVRTDSFHWRMGILSSDLERTLLGAEVNKIVDKLSFGWYESIFQSYMATKPVKVVSSMGQQSVGKSFALNHLLDTSFAGSAMRTTGMQRECGCPVTPTDEALIVALDFEGVDSIERSLQEDMLLVLFNTAISNLVLFRNNFAFSRDISGLFQSFQSSASVLDPAANPSLFQSTLVIIIKDVVESDKVEITREFSLKFQKIVQQEQRANFISHLHRGRLNIIPVGQDWLDLQSVSHPTAGEFLHTIKTLMAKLKANDWGALSRTNLDTDLEVEGNYMDARFAISGCEQISPMDVERHLSVLLESWNQSFPRQFMPDSEWIEGFVLHLHGLIDSRMNYVRLWLDSNLERFQDGHATIEDLLRSCVVNAHLCGEPCALSGKRGCLDDCTKVSYCDFA